MKNMKGCDAAIKEANTGKGGGTGTMRGAAGMKYSFGDRGKGGKSSAAKAMNHRKGK